jgi:hypothetical protein
MINDETVAQWRAETPGRASGAPEQRRSRADAVAVISAMTDHIALESEIGGYEAADAQVRNRGRVSRSRR